MSRETVSREGGVPEVPASIPHVEAAGDLARVNPETFSAPVARSVRARFSNVAPVVYTSSTIRMDRPQMDEGEETWKAPMRFLLRSRRPEALCEGVKRTRFTE